MKTLVPLLFHPSILHFSPFIALPALDGTGGQDFLKFVLGLLLAVAFIPLDVERTLRRPPRCTSILIALNVVIFLVAVGSANLHLSQDRAEGQRLLTRWHYGYGAAGETMALRQARDADGYRRLWQMEHAYSSYVLEPGYAVLNDYAYHPVETAGPRRLLGLFGSMFLHGGPLHLFGNMLFLWVFGRALEDEVGSAWFALTYLLAGLCGTLLYHAAVLQFWPATAGLPALGASGAVAGLLGASAIRLRRDRVHVWCLPPLSWPVLAIVSALIAGLIHLGVGALAGRAVFLATMAGLFWFGPGLMWKVHEMPSRWAIGAWLLLFNVLPGAWSAATGHSEGVAHWAHIGGFLAGMIAALVPTAALHLTRPRPVAQPTRPAPRPAEVAHGEETTYLE